MTARGSVGIKQIFTSYDDLGGKTNGERFTRRIEKGLLWLGEAATLGRPDRGG